MTLVIRKDGSICFDRAIPPNERVYKEAEIIGGATGPLKPEDWATASVTYRERVYILIAVTPRHRIFEELG